MIDMSEIEDKIESIIKFVTMLYNPKKVRVRTTSYEGVKEYYIIFTFDSIPDKYISNPNHHDIIAHKESLFSREIREYIENYMGIKTSGLQYLNNYFSPTELHGISIDVISEE